jgi:membrane protein required for colicin V production
MGMVSFLNQFSAIDIIFIVIISVSAVLAFLNGAIKEGLSLIKWIVSAFLAKTHVDILDKYVNIQPFLVKKLVVFCLIFIILSICLQLINVVLDRFIKISGIGLLNKFIGMLFGTCRGVIIVAVISIIIPIFDHSYNVQQSRIYPLLSPALNSITQYKSII